MPGGPKRRIPRHQHLSQRIRLTLDVLDTEFLDQAWREDSTSECSSENGREFSVKTSNTHVLEFEVGGQDGVGGSTELSAPGNGQCLPLGRVLELDVTGRIFDPDDLCALHDDSRGSVVSVQRGDGADHCFQFMAPVVEYQGLKGC